MDEKPQEDQQESVQTTEASESVKTIKKAGFKTRFKKLSPWVVAVLVFIIVCGLAIVSFHFYKKTDSLSNENKNLNGIIDNYKKANSKPENLTDITLQSVTDEIPATPAAIPAEESTYGGIAVQVNSEDPNAANPVYAGGEYAPFWILARYALTIPDGVKMIRTTDMSTSGRLLTAENEGGAGCGGEGIYMSVSSNISVPGGAFRAHGSSTTYERGVGCGGADPAVTLYVKQYPMTKIAGYKYIEVVIAECKNQTDDYVCITSSVDKAKWRLFSGIVPIDAVEIKVGEAIDAGTIIRQLYDRGKNELQFYFDCTDDKYSNFSCNAEHYKGDYTTALKDSNYTRIKDIVLGMHPY